MARPKGAEQGVRNPDRLRVGYDFPTFDGVNTEDDPGNLSASEFVKLTNVEHNGKRIIPRPGLAKLTDNPLDGGKVYGLFDDHAGDVQGRSGPQLYVPSGVTLIGYDRHTGVYAIPGTATEESRIMAILGSPRTQGVTQGLLGKDHQVLIGRAQGEATPADTDTVVVYLPQTTAAGTMYTHGINYSPEFQDSALGTGAHSDYHPGQVPLLAPGNGYVYFATSVRGGNGITGYTYTRRLYRFPEIGDVTTAPAITPTLLCSDVWQHPDTGGYDLVLLNERPISVVQTEDGKFWVSFGTFGGATASTFTVYEIEETSPGTFSMSADPETHRLTGSVVSFGLVLVPLGNDLIACDLAYVQGPSMPADMGSVVWKRASDGTWTQLTLPAEIDPAVTVTGHFGAHVGIVFDGKVYFGGYLYDGDPAADHPSLGIIFSVDDADNVTLEHSVVPLSGVDSPPVWAMCTDGEAIYYSWGQGGAGLYVGQFNGTTWDDDAGGHVSATAANGSAMWRQGSKLFVGLGDYGGFGNTASDPFVAETTLPLGGAWTNHLLDTYSLTNYMANPKNEVAGANGSVPTEHTAPFTRIGTPVGGVNGWVCDPGPTNDGNLVAYIGDNNAATRIYSPGTEMIQFFGIDAPDIPDAKPVTHVTLHMIAYVPDGVTDGIQITGEAGLNGQAEAALPQFPMRDGVPMAFEINRPGGGNWTGADLKDASLAFTAFFIWGHENNGHQPRITDMWLTYVA